MSITSRGPNQLAITLDSARARMQQIEAHGAGIRTEYEGLQRDLAVLKDDYSLELTKEWEPHVRQALAELKRRHEPDIENILPQSLKAVV